MGLFAGRDDRDETIARLRGDLEKIQIRLEEVAAYYRGELESVRQRAEDEAVRIQAAEAGRRKRAEEQVAYLKGELQSARADAEHAQRRYQDLLQRLDELEVQSEQDTRDEMDRFREAAKAAWKTAEEEVERLDRELGETRRKREQESEERRQLERSYEQLEERHQLEKRDRLRLIGRLKRGLSASEARRRAAENAAAPAASGLHRFAEQPERVVDPSREWSGLALGNADDFTDEFLMTNSDESFALRRHEPKVDEPASAPREPVEEEVSDMEAEELMMTLDVDEQVARRQARSRARRQPSLPPSPPRDAAAPAVQTDVRRGRGWAWLAAASLVAVGSAVGLLML